MFARLILAVFFAAVTAFSQQLPPIEPGVSQELAKWRAVQYSNISYKLNLTLEKMSPVLKGSIEIRVTKAAYACAEPNCPPLYIVLDWRKLPGHEKESTVSNVSLNGKSIECFIAWPVNDASIPLPTAKPCYEELDDHLIFHDGVRMGENVIKGRCPPHIGPSGRRRRNGSSLSRLPGTQHPGVAARSLALRS